MLSKYQPFAARACGGIYQGVVLDICHICGELTGECDMHPSPFVACSSCEVDPCGLSGTCGVLLVALVPPRKFRRVKASL
jgi:hypothetical protein